jgi:aldehyde dehydrogenase (NAD+)
LHFTCSELPFGGIGNSGMGGYNGKYSFETFSHSKSVLNRGYSLDSCKFFFNELALRYPPYTSKNINWLKTLSNPSLSSILSTAWSNYNLEEKKE